MSALFRIIAALLAIALLAGQARAENEPKVIILSCDGMVTHTVVSGQPKPVEKMGVVAFMGWVA